MKEVLLIALSTDTCDYPAEGRFRVKTLQARPTLGLLYLCSALESKGKSCKILEQAVNPFSIEDLILEINNGRYLFVGFYTQLLIHEKTCEYIQEIKKNCSGCVIVTGGPGALCAKEYLTAGSDIVCNGEGEETILDIVEFCEGRKKIKNIPGIFYIDEGAMVFSGERPFIADLDVISFPSWENVAVDRYFDFSVIPLRKPFVVMTTSRGCLYNCAFCAAPFFWRNSYRVRSVSNVLEEIDWLVKRFKIKYIIFQDEIFGADKQWLRTFCEQLIKRRYSGLKWMCVLHPFTLKDDSEQLIRLMKLAGCNLFSFGLQAVNKKVLININRSPLEATALENVITIAGNMGIMTSIDFIVGLPGDTQQSIQESIFFALKIRPHLVNFHPLRIEPGSLLAQTHNNSSVCSMSNEEIRTWCHLGNKKFYYDIKNILKILMFVLKENPIYLLNIGKLLTILRNL